MDSITFPNGPIAMAGNLFLPDNFDPQSSYAAVVTVHPGGGVKEQTAGLYAAKLAEEASWHSPTTPRSRVRAAANLTTSRTRQRESRTCARPSTSCRAWTTWTPSGSVFSVSAPAVDTP